MMSTSETIQITTMKIQSNHQNQAMSSLLSFPQPRVRRRSSQRVIPKA